MPNTLSTGLALHLAWRLRAVRRRHRKRLARCRKKFSEKAVHELRIETRRLLALLNLLDTLQVGDGRDQLRKTVKKRLDWFDELRDTQVQLRLLKPFWRNFPGARPLGNILKASEARLINRLARKINASRPLRLNRRLKRLEKSLRPQAGFATARAVSREATAALSAAFRRVILLRRRVRPDDTKTIHRLRLAFKQFRYLSELLQLVAPSITRPCLKGMKAYQDLAGNIQDLEVLLARVALAVKERELKAEDIRRLRRDLSRQRRRAISAFLARIDDLDGFRPGPSSPAATGKTQTLHP